MKSTALLMTLILAGSSFSCRSDKSDAVAENLNVQSVELLCEEITSGGDAPAASIYLKTGERKTKIADIQGLCSVIASEAYAGYEMPAETLSAVGSWWAGSGDYFYAVLENNKIFVYQGFADEMQEEFGFNYRAIVTFDGKKYAFLSTTEAN